MDEKKHLKFCLFIIRYRYRYRYRYRLAPHLRAGSIHMLYPYQPLLCSKKADNTCVLIESEPDGDDDTRQGKRHRNRAMKTDI
jgi:hypothetical protein